MIFITCVIIITFSYWGGTRSGRTMTGDKSDTAFTIYGHDYTVGEMQRYQRYMQLAYSMGIYDLAQQLTMVSRQYQTDDRIPLDFVFNLLVLREEMKKNGVAVSDAEARTEMEKLPAFQNEGKFDPARANMVEENLGAFGFNSSDMIEIVKDKIGLDKLRTLVGGGVTPSPMAVSKLYARQYQTIKMSTITFALDEFKKKAQVTDEEIKKYFDEKKDSYKTAEKRAISYVFFEEPKDLDKLEIDKRMKAQNEFGDKVNKFNEATLKPGAKLELIAAVEKVKVQTLPPFSQDAPPDAIKAESELLSAVFRHDAAGHPVSDPVKGSKGYYFFTLTRIEEPKQQELKDVKDKIKDALALQKAQEAMMKSANETREALQAGIKGGKKLADLAKEKQLALVEQPEFSPSSPSPDMKLGFEVTQEAVKTPAGQLSKPVDSDVGVILVHVNAKELRKREDSASLKQNMEQSISFREQFEVFKAWFEQRRKEANLKVHFSVA